MLEINYEKCSDLFLCVMNIKAYVRETRECIWPHQKCPFVTNCKSLALKVATFNATEHISASSNLAQFHCNHLTAGACI